MAAPGSELGWVVHFAPMVRFTPLSPTYVHGVYGVAKENVPNFGSVIFVYVR